MSGARDATATARPPASRDAIPPPAVVTAPVPPAPPTNVAETRPLPIDQAATVVPQAPATVAPPAPTALLPSHPTSDVIALILPLASPAYGRAAEAVKAGFLAAADRAAGGAKVSVIGHGDDGVLPAFASAASAGDALVVGPLTRDDLKTVVAMAPERPRMLALNQTDDGSRLPDDAYALSLSVDSDATLLARVAQENGVRVMAKVVGKGALQRRFAAAFTVQWDRQGGAPMHEYAFDGNPETLGAIRKDMAARPPDAVLLAVDGEDAALARAFLPPGPVYASSQIADGLAPEMLRDLEGVRYIEIPWVADPDNAAFAGIARGPGGDVLSARLYALGLDAYAVAAMLDVTSATPDRIELDGATGHLSLTPSHVFVREGRVMVIRGGRPQLLQAGP